MDPDHPALDHLRRLGLLDCYGEYAAAYTSNPNQRAKRIDFVFTGPDVKAAALPIRAISDTTPLPSREQPSDHIAIGIDISIPHTELASAKV